MTNARTVKLSIKSTSGAIGLSSFLEPFLIFKGKLRAAATRDRYHDAADLRKLGEMYEADIKARAHELNLEYVGLAMKRNGVLELLFKRLGVDTKAAKATVADFDLAMLPPPAPGDVHKGLLG